MLTSLPQRSQSKHYRGRFAPSPSGPLHFGSLVTALASYLDAKYHQGKWLVRIEDIDPPREQIGASDNILRTLEAYGLGWDEDILYQSQQSELYQAVLEELRQNNLAYYCTCTRAQIKTYGGIYQGHCRSLNQPSANSAIRVINTQPVDSFNDIYQGKVQCSTALAYEDFTVFRKDGLFAYQLAVVVDDIKQDISHIIRGADLLEPTARQLSFYQILEQPAPVFGHVPLVVTAEGYKLSKQNKAPAINIDKPQGILVAALKFLGQQPPKTLEKESVTAIIDWARQNFCPDKIPQKQQISLESLNIFE